MKILFLCILAVPLYSQVQITPASFYTMSNAMSLDGSNLPASIYSNMAGLDMAGSSSLSVGMSLYPGLPGIYAARASWVMKAKEWTFGLAALRNGSPYFNFQELSLSSSVKVGITAIGIRINWHQLFFSEVATYHLPGIDLGAVCDLSPDLQTGVYMAHLNKPAIRGEYKENLPLLLSSAVRYKVSDKIGWYGECTLTEGIPLFFRTCMEYMPDDRFSIRLGTGNGPLRIIAGLTWSAGRTVLRYSYSSLPFPGSVQSWDIGYSY